MSYKVLYIEDEPFLARIVSDGLKSSNYEVTWVDDGGQVLKAFDSLEPDLCILDIMLPSKDGYSIAEEIRAKSPDMPIIFLSAKSLTEDIVKGFKSGGNDYLKKPFSMDELLVRMEALLFRYKKKPATNVITELFNFSTCSLDTIHQVLKTTTGQHHLSFKETALLEMLILNQNKVLERKTVLLKIWGDDSFYNTRSMDVFMTHIRKLLKDEQGIKIINVRNVGYKMTF
ncbi:response regulator transcription factor [Mucilaginibacter sp. E4BP6]|uniref:response regulator transcription factor n=1 Tax=Mucilaginibacter sp. E4BP6 TaxID=2723089 RepID=UPI0015C8A673|nr:response regulator transcription factor [Mucilaginibacter sp. E4BP6]NYE64950.1 DNA-binding response OmpR family regulator [Mucilaginibacter sp. E4BP6]